MVSLYALLDPETLEVRYVGQTIKALEHRLLQHCCSRRKCHLTNWIASLKAKGLKPLIREVDQVIEDDADDYEINYIAYYKTLGYNLTNNDGGGVGRSRVVSDETKERISAARTGKPRPDLKGKKRPPEVIAKISAGKLGDKNPMKRPEVVAKMSQSRKGQPSPKGMLGKKHTEEWKARMSLALAGNNNPNYGKTISEETRLKMSVAHKNISEETRARMSASRKGKPWTETRRAAQEKKKRDADGNYTYLQ